MYRSLLSSAYMQRSFKHTQPSIVNNNHIRALSLYAKNLEGELLSFLNGTEARSKLSRPQRRLYTTGIKSLFSTFSRNKLDVFVLKSMELKANNEPGNATHQHVFLNALQSLGFKEEVVSRVESGRFASNWAILDLYVNVVSSIYSLNIEESSELRARVRTLFNQYSHGGDTAVIPTEAFHNALIGTRVVPGGITSRGSYPLPATPASESVGPVGPRAVPTFGSGTSLSNFTQTKPILVEVQQPRSSHMWALLRFLISLGFIGGMYYWLSTRMSGGPFSALTGDIVEEVTDIPEIRFSDVRGADEAKAELQDIVEFLRDPEKFKRLGAKIPRGVLLTGPPGTGKTLLARAVAGEAGCKFYSKSASEFEEMLVGLGAKRIRELFDAARKNAPAIIFIDEIDALGSKRKVSIGGGSERQTLNQLLSSMDGFTKNENVIVIAATNTPDILDAALKRPGRFDSMVNVPLPDSKGRKEILDLYFGKVVARGINTELLSKATIGFSGAQIEAMVNSAALMAANRGADAVTMADVEEARDKVIMGPSRRNPVLKRKTMELTAYHEGGHTLVSLLTRGTDPLHKVTILPRGQSGGATYSLPKDDDMLTREAILAQIDVCMGGRVAEELVYGGDNVTTGAGMDMSQASDLARRYCAVYSMSRLGLQSFSGLVSQTGTSPSPARQALIDEEVERILQESYRRVSELMKSNRPKLERLAKALLEFETLTAEECRLVIEGGSISTGAAGSAASEVNGRRKSPSGNSKHLGSSSGPSGPSGNSGKKKVEDIGSVVGGKPSVWTADTSSSRSNEPVEEKRSSTWS